MAHEWKAGDRAVVEIVRPPNLCGWTVVKNGADNESAIPASALTPLPASDPHDALRAAVVEDRAMKLDQEALEKARDVFHASRLIVRPRDDDPFAEAIRAYLTAAWNTRALPDREAVARAICCPHGCMAEQGADTRCAVVPLNDPEWGGGDLTITNVGASIDAVLNLLKGHTP
jgi:hypothetical protein